MYSTSFYCSHKIAQIWQGFHLCVSNKCSPASDVRSFNFVPNTLVWFHVCQLPSNKGLRGSPCALFSVSSKGFEGLRVRRCLIDRRWVRASRLRTSMVGCAWQKPAFLYTPPPPLLMPAFQLQETLETGIAAWCEAQQPAIGPRGRARCRAVTHRVTRGAEDCSVQPSAWFPVKESAGREGACYRMANLTHRIVLLAECNSTYRHCMCGMPSPLFR